MCSSTDYSYDVAEWVYKHGTIRRLTWFTSCSKPTKKDPNSFILDKVNVKSTLIQALRLCTGRTAPRGSRGITLCFLDHGTRSGWGVSVTPRPLFPPGKDPVPIVQEVVWAPGPVWTGAENLTHIWIRSPDRPVRSQSLYRLRYAAHTGQTRVVISSLGCYVFQRALHNTDISNSPIQS